MNENKAEFSRFYVSERKVSETKGQAGWEEVPGCLILLYAAFH